MKQRKLISLQNADEHLLQALLSRYPDGEIEANTSINMNGQNVKVAMIEVEDVLYMVKINQDQNVKRFLEDFDDDSWENEMETDSDFASYDD